jgi:hypothetical protein
MSRFMLVCLLCLTTQFAWSRSLDCGPVRVPSQSLDSANPQDENYVLRNGSLAFNFTNYGMFGNDNIYESSLSDPCSYAWAPQFEYPEGSGAQYLYQGALWLGALIEEQGFYSTRVSVGTDGWQNPSINEFHAGEAPDHGIVLRSNLPDATDCYGNSIYDPNAQANIEAVAVYSDTLTDQLFVRNDPMDGPHRPLGLQVTQTARLWTAPEFARFVILDFEIENIGQNFLKNVSLGFYLDADIGLADESERHTDDISGSLVIDPLIGNLIGWSADNDGRANNDPNGPLVVPDAIGLAGLSEPDTFGGGNIVHCFNWWQSNASPDLDYGPAWSDDPQWDCDYGSQVGDEHKYHVLRNRERDYNSYEQTEPSPQADTSFWCASDGELHEWCEVENYFEQSDTRFMLSWDKISWYDFTDGAGNCVYRLNPGERFSYSVAMFIGPDFHDANGNEYHFDGLYESYARAKLLFDQEYVFQPLSHPQNMRAVQTESGQIPLVWDAPAHGELAGYRVYGRPDSGQGDRVLFTPQTIFDEEYVITGLTNGDDWLIEVVAVDVQNFESAAARKMVRVGAIPNNITLTGLSEAGVNTLSWSATADPTFTHFRIVRTDSTGETEFDNLTDTTLTDGEIMSGRTYTYALYLHNTIGVTSYPSNTVTLTPFAPGNTILVYDETKTPSPVDLQRGCLPDSAIRAWYESILTSLGEEYEYIDLANDVAPLTLQTLAAHEIVIWQSENPLNSRTGYQVNLREAALREYVALGGKLIRFGRHTLWASGVFGMPSEVGYIENRQSELARLEPLTFDSVWIAPQYSLSNPWSIVMVIGTNSGAPGFPSEFSWDQDKLAQLTYMNQQDFEFLPGVDFFWRQGNTWPLYGATMHANDTSGFMEPPCAVVGPGEIFFGFPLYFVPEEQAQDLVAASLELLRTQVLETPKPPDEPLPTSITLSQNYPNPFNANTVIEFELPMTTNGALRVYNIRGQLVSTLANGSLAAGIHRVNFDATGLSTGLYFYRLELGQESFTRKLLLLK